MIRQWFGVYQGVVVKTSDPLGQLRVILTVPQVLGTAYSQWAVPLSSSEGSPPAAGALVAVMFLGGDVNHPAYFYPVVITTGAPPSFSQAVVSSSTATVNHNLGLYPVVVVRDGSGNVVVPDVQYTSTNQVVVTFGAPFTGTVLCTA